jgi:hypothetical protein
VYLNAVGGYFVSNDRAVASSAIFILAKKVRSNGPFLDTKAQSRTLC